MGWFSLQPFPSQVVPLLFCLDSRFVPGHAHKISVQARRSIFFREGGSTSIRSLTRSLFFSCYEGAGSQTLRVQVTPHNYRSGFNDLCSFSQHKAARPLISSARYLLRDLRIQVMPIILLCRRIGQASFWRVVLQPALPKPGRSLISEWQWCVLPNLASPGRPMTCPFMLQNMFCGSRFNLRRPGRSLIFLARYVLRNWLAKVTPMTFSV